MTAFIFLLGWAVSGLIGLWLYIGTRYKLTDVVDAEDLVQGCLLWIAGPIGILLGIIYWGSKIGWRIKIIQRKKT